MRRRAIRASLTLRSLDEGRFAKHQAGVTFLQIGADEEASEFLRSLDDDLEEKYSVRDIVDWSVRPCQLRVR